MGSSARNSDFFGFMLFRGIAGRPIRFANLGPLCVHEFFIHMDICYTVVLGVRRDLGKPPLAEAKHPDICRYIGIDTYRISAIRSADRDDIVSVDISKYTDADTQP